jgi:dihydropyrimidinase
MTFDRVVRGGSVVTVGGARVADVGIRDGRIVAVERAIPDSAGAEVVDATGLLVLPGAVDVHTHVRIPSDDEPDRFFTDSVAAAFGGTTTFLAFDNPGTGISAAGQRTLRAGIEEWRASTSGESAVDIGLSAVVTAQQEDPEADVEAAVADGVATFKCFLVYDFGVDESRLRSLLEAVDRVGGMLQVHGEDRALLDEGIARELEAGRTRPIHHAASRPPIVEATGTARAIEVAAEVGAPVYFVHVSCGPAVDAIAAARRRGQPVYAETCPHYLTLDDSRCALPDEIAITTVLSPPLRSLADQATMWAAVDDGRLDLIATDHVPDRLAVEKRWLGQPFTEISNGAPGIETLLPTIYGRGVATGRITLERMVDLVSTTPARLFGLRDKGAIEVGKDADLVLLDPAASRVIRGEDLHHTSDFTPYEGMELPGVIRRVIVRGVDVVVGDAFVGRRGHGRYVARSLSG